MRGFSNTEKVYRGLSSPWIKIICLILVSAASVLQIVAVFQKEMAAWYVMHVYPFFLRLFGSISGCFPFPLAEAGAYSLIILIIGYMILFWGESMGKTAENLLICLLTLLVVLAVLNRGINASAPSFAEREKVEIGRYDTDDLIEFCAFLVGQINQNPADLSRRDYSSWEDEGRQAVTELGEVFPSLKGYYPKPRQMLYSSLLSSVRIGGIYVPFTAEVIYNGEMAPFNIPFTICHELAHAKGFIQENDADFIAYLACVSSEDQELRYSGYLSAWLYAGNDLVEVDPGEYRRLSAMLPEQAKEDLKASNEFWRREAGTLLAVDALAAGLTSGEKKSGQASLRSYERYELIGLMIEEYRGGFKKGQERDVKKR